jgi:hypothetical protein
VKTTRPASNDRNVQHLVVRLSQMRIGRCAFTPRRKCVGESGVVASGRTAERTQWCVVVHQSIGATRRVRRRAVAALGAFIIEAFRIFARVLPIAPGM